MKRVRSADGTWIAYEKSGQGPPLILVGGAFCDRNARAAGTPLAALLPNLCVYSYDRRGRGDSTNTEPWSVAREVEDLAALIQEAGGSANVFGISSGGFLACEAALRGLPIPELALYEAPLDVSGGHHPPREFAARLRALCAAGKPSDAAALFLTDAIGVPAPVVDNMRNSSHWPFMTRIAPTLAADAELATDAVSLLDRAPKIRARTLVLYGGASPAWIRDSLAAFAKALPHAVERSLSGQTHDVAPELLAPALAEFFAAQ